MKFTQDGTDSGYAIQSYAEGQVSISGKRFTDSLIITPQRVITDWRPADFSSLLPDDFSRLVELGPELVILGTGSTQRFPHPSLTQALMQQRIGLEAMDTAAACRTYNILMAEGRKVAAALFML